MIDYPAAQAVALVVQTGSFEKAARALNVTPSAISQRVRQLEDRLGAVLIERGVPCTATEHGEWLCRHVEHVGMLENELTAHLPGLRGREPRRQRVTLNIATNADSLGTWFVEAMSGFARDSDHLLKLSIDDEEHTADWLARGRVLAAVTALGKPVQGCRVIPLGSLFYHATASPDYVERHFPDGVTAAALAGAPALTFNQKDSLQRQWIRKFTGQDLQHPTHWLPSTQSFVDASLVGLGWCLNPVQLAEAHIATGRLVDLSPGLLVEVPLFWQVSRLAADALDDLTRHVVATARRELRGRGGGAPASRSRG